MFRQKLDEARVVSKDIDRPRFDLCEHALVEVLDSERHLSMLAKTLTLCNLLAIATQPRRVCSGAESLAESADRHQADVRFGYQLRAMHEMRHLKRSNPATESAGGPPLEMLKSAT